MKQPPTQSEPLLTQILPEPQLVPLGSLDQLVVERGLAPAETLARARLVRSETGEPLDTVLTRLGMVSEQALARAMRRLLQDRRERLRWLGGRAALVSPATRLTQHAVRLGNLEQRLERAARETLRRAREGLSPLVRTLHAVSPLATLERGYAIVSTVDGQILRDAAAAQPGLVIEARLARGRLRAKVEGSS